MTSARATQAKVLLAIVAVFIVVSNTVGDGNALGGVAFFVWALSALALIGLGIKTLIERRQVNGSS